MKTTPPPEAPPVAVWVRIVACAAWLATLALTWNVWQHRAFPPMLPALALPSFSMGPWLVATALWMCVRPRWGAPAHALVLAWALATDVLRLQPFALSLALLFWGTTGGDGALLVARAHLVALWLWGALHKALSPAFTGTVIPWVIAGVAPGWHRAEPYAGPSLIAAELALAGMAVFPRTRRAAAWFAVVVHASILAVVSRPALGRNVALWPWNLCLATLPLALLVPWRASWRETLDTHPRWSIALAAALVVMPAGYYSGLVGPTLAHVLYTGAAPDTVRCNARGDCASDAERRTCVTRLRVMVPPDPEVLRRYFLARCDAGERLMIHDPRRDGDDGSAPIEVVRCPPSR